MIIPLYFDPQRYLYLVRKALHEKSGAGLACAAFTVVDLTRAYSASKFSFI
jgi:hypothetical protein